MPKAKRITIDHAEAAQITSMIVTAIRETASEKDAAQNAFDEGELGALGLIERNQRLDRTETLLRRLARKVNA